MSKLAFDAMKFTNLQDVRTAKADRDVERSLERLAYDNYHHSYLWAK